MSCVMDVTGVKKETAGREYFKTGLHNGLSWKETLVAAWEEIARQLGAEQMVIQASTNSSWQTVKESGWNTYDGVAKSLGFTQSYITQNWVKPIASLAE
jgi:hypothetical protein